AITDWSSTNPLKSLDFKIRLRDELVQRCKRNQAYSLRAFASSLELDASTLSKLLNGKRPLGRKLILQLGAKIGLTAEETSAYLASGEADESSVERLKFEQLSLDRFAVVSDWYHFAILELMQVEGFQSDAVWIASALGMKSAEANAAIDRLTRVGLLEVKEDGSWLDLSGGFTTSIGPDMVSSAHRRLQEQLLQKATDALATVPLEERDHSTMTMAVDRSRLPEAREKIRRFRRELAEFLVAGEVQNEIFNLNIALFPITHLNKRKNV
ncbi:MAG: TIGR02147 family protein, partial [Proteobacteria bacterium]